MSQEVWKTITEFENYEVSNMGKIRNKITGYDKILQLSHDHYVVNLWKNGKSKNLNVNQLVAKYFLENPQEYIRLEYIDGDRSNLKVSNLRWTNVIHTSNIKLGDKISQLNSKSRKVEKIWESYIDICQELKISWSDLNSAYKNKTILLDSFWEIHFDKEAIGEEWKDYGNYHEVSNKGRFRNRITKRLMKLTVADDGYVRITIGKQSNYIHRLVAGAFIPRISGKPFVNHIDGNKQNNCVANLEWVTHMENMQHAYATGLMEIRKGVGSKVDQIDFKTNKVVKTWSTMKELAINLNISTKSLRNCIIKNYIINKYYYDFHIDDDLEDEEWKITHISDKYKVSNYGRIKNELDQILEMTNGVYKRVNIHAKWYQAHVIVAKAFIPNPNGYNVVNHLDGDKYNNHISNLEWTTYSGNLKHAIATGLNKSSRCQKVIQYSLTDESINTYNSLREAQRSTGIHKESIQKCCKGIFSQAGGYKWKFANKKN